MPTLAELTVLTGGKGGAEKKPPSTEDKRKANVRAALRAAFNAAKSADEDKFMDAMEGALGLASIPED